MLTVPSVFYSFFAGSLSDDYGRKPLIILPTFGVVIGMILSIINYSFIETLPIEFFYISGPAWWMFLGGNAVYYLGQWFLNFLMNSNFKPMWISTNKINKFEKVNNLRRCEFH